MQETKDGYTCVVGFGKDGQEILTTCTDAFPIKKYVSLNNPQPTGDYWKVLEWITKYQRTPSILAKFPIQRRNFIKAAASALETGGFYMELVSQTARKFRDDNNLRMQRGKVYVFVSKDILP